MENTYAFLFAKAGSIARQARAGKYAVSFNTQVLIFLSLLLRYLPVIVDTEPMLEVVCFPRLDFAVVTPCLIT